MPLYEYECRNCNYRLEKLQAYGEEPLTTCPKCEGVLVRVISPPGFNFKGGKPSEERRMQDGRPIHQTDDGHWEQDGIMDRR